ncbi:hypothetical protein V6N13_053667 [Hibiscus sabdariffa]
MESCGVSESTSLVGEKVSEPRNLEDLYGTWMQVTNKRCRNDNYQGFNVRIGGSTREKEVMGSRFAALSTDNSDGIVEVSYMHPMVNEHKNRDVSRGVSLASKGCDHGVQSNADKFVLLQWKQSIDPRKSVGVVIGAGKGSVGQASLTVGAAAQVDHGGGVKAVASIERVARAKSSLNGEKHVAIQVGAVEETQTNQSAEGRVLPTSIRGSTIKTRSKIQLGVEGVHN